MKFAETEKVLVAVAILALLLPFSSAAKIYGEIYNIELEPVGALVKINTTPEQKAIFHGNYSFYVPLGVYMLEAFSVEKGIVYSDSELLKIEQEGNYRVDLILMETEEELFLNDTELNSIVELLNLISEEKKTNWKAIAIAIAIAAFIFVVLVIVVVKLRKRKKAERLRKGKARRKGKEKAKEAEAKAREESEESKEKILELLRTDTFKKQVIDILQKERRILQRDLRKKLNVSEAKLSLLVSELEAEGKVKKIKRGRTNILIWQEV
jgi:uncharacterized membrane protein